MDAPVPMSESLKPEKPLLAPVWHTIVLVLFLLTLSALGSSGHPGLTHSQRVRFYGLTIAMEWVMLLFIAWGLRKGKRTNMRELIGGRWGKPEDFLLDVVIAIGFWVASALVLAGLGYLLGMNNVATLKEQKERVGAMLPEGSLEIGLWLGLSVTAGICEEVIFRGYFQKQFAALFSLAWVGIVAQGVLFGASHAYEGWKQMVRIAVFGIMFGLLAYWRKSLRPGMMAHATQDTLAGLLGRFALKFAEKAGAK